MKRRSMKEQFNFRIAIVNMSSSRRSYFSLLSVLVITLAASSVQSANILGVFTSHSPSHLIVHMSVMKALAERGHNVTVFSSVKSSIKHKNIKLTVLPLEPEEEKILASALTNMAQEKSTIINNLKRFFGSLSIMIDKQFDFVKDPRFTWIYDNADTKFDVLFVGAFINTYQIGIGAKLKIPVIVDWTAQPMELTDDLIGNPREVSYVPNIHLSYNQRDPITFSFRLKNFFYSLFMRALRILIDMRMTTFYNHLYADDKSMPSYNNAKKNVSLVFCNSHALSEGPIRPNVPSLIEIGGIQVKDTPDPLPEDIAKFLDNAKQGAILFSLGSNLKSEYVKPEIIQTIFKTLSALKQNVIWKWENLENTPGKASNILYKAWLPQDDILAHPNLKLFITHAGKGGVAEAQYHAVPMLALPIFAEQPVNAEKIVDNGFGLSLELLKLEKKAFENAVSEILENPQYAKNIKAFSQLYRDRPLTARENVVFWTEYIIRHRGAPHIQSPLVHLNLIESLNLDIYLFICFVLYVIYFAFRLVVKFVIKKIFKKSSSKKQPKLKKK